MAKARIIVASLTLSASALIGLAVSEGYTDRAVIRRRTTDRRTDSEAPSTLTARL